MEKIFRVSGTIRNGLRPFLMGVKTRNIWGGDYQLLDTNIRCFDTSNFSNIEFFCRKLMKIQYCDNKRQPTTVFVATHPVLLNLYGFAQKGDTTMTNVKEQCAFQTVSIPSLFENRLPPFCLEYESNSQLNYRT